MRTFCSFAAGLLVSSADGLSDLSNPSPSPAPSAVATTYDCGFYELAGIDLELDLKEGFIPDHGTKVIEGACVAPSNSSVLLSWQWQWQNSSDWWGVETAWYQTIFNETRNCTGNSKFDPWGYSFHRFGNCPDFDGDFDLRVGGLDCRKILPDDFMRYDFQWCLDCGYPGPRMYPRDSSDQCGRPVPSEISI
jgi:hypothetical protein